MTLWHFARQLCTGGCFFLAGVALKEVLDIRVARVEASVDQLETDVHEEGKEVAVKLVKLTMAVEELKEDQRKSRMKMSAMERELSGMRLALRTSALQWSDFATINK